MDRSPIAVFMLAMLLWAPGCVTHEVADDYGQYLTNQDGTVKLPETGLTAVYSLTPATFEHRLEFKSATTGLANTWAVEFGKMLQATLQSQDVRRAFAELSPAPAADGADTVKLTFDLENYHFEDSRAKIELAVAVSGGGVAPFRNAYRAEGASQGGKMFWGGAFAMRNAIHQSTKLAMDEILAEFLNDLWAQTQAHTATP